MQTIKLSHCKVFFLPPTQHSYFFKDKLNLSGQLGLELKSGVTDVCHNWQESCTICSCCFQISSCIRHGLNRIGKCCQLKGSVFKHVELCVGRNALCKSSPLLLLQKNLLSNCSQEGHHWNIECLYSTLTIQYNFINPQGQLQV